MPEAKFEGSITGLRPMNELQPTFHHGNRDIPVLTVLICLHQAYFGVRSPQATSRSLAFGRAFATLTPLFVNSVSLSTKPRGRLPLGLTMYPVRAAEVVPAWRGFQRGHASSRDDYLERSRR